jgi:ribosomal protein S1
MRSKDIAMKNDETEWDRVKTNELAPGAIVQGAVQRHLPFGVFVEIRGVPFTGLVQIVDFKDEGVMTVDEYPPIGSYIKAVVLGFRDSNNQISLGMRPSQLAKGRPSQ